MLGDKKCPASTDIKRHVVPLVHRAYPICGKNLNPELQQVPTEPSSVQGCQCLLHDGGYGRVSTLPSSLPSCTCWSNNARINAVSCAVFTETTTS
ncbi:hypothetical protein L596_017154 [Steinernema carpocapsae]|uniref:Uncharacterized protein n=1 Tax=Steinernema carpocapsae TaxID=34508 RepID=A0A4U5N1H8_STECR|nr:hypothetical protein L596_017151 [Steinernema carpocapsae]TKR75933.1 hypothetical protein L596_017153 [Steinernema carpocapsae]TKR75934.1 hypothetical protein L596_017154 [Steinernema carpocapsae]